MSHIKDYIAEMMNKGIDVLADRDDYDYEYERYQEEYQKSLREMNKDFQETEVKSETPENNG